MNIQIKILDPRIGTEFPLPQFATEGSAAFDLRAMIDEPITLLEGQAMLIPTGISVYIKDPLTVGMIFPRSGLGHKEGIVLGNGTGIIDSDYQGPIFVSCLNRNMPEKVDNVRIPRARTIEVGERIAQFVVLPIIRPTFDIVDTFEASERGEGGFGSSGRH